MISRAEITLSAPLVTNLKPDVRLNILTLTEGEGCIRVLTISYRRRASRRHTWYFFFCIVSRLDLLRLDLPADEVTVSVDEGAGKSVFIYRAS